MFCNFSDDWLDFESEIQIEEEYSVNLSIANPDSSKNKWECLSLDEHLKASTVSGLIDKFTGASNYLNDKKISSQVSRVLVLQAVTVKQRMHLLNPVDYETVKSDATKSTHAIVGTTYGLEAYCVIFQDLDEKESREDSEENLSDLVIKMKKSLTEKHVWNNFEEQLSKIEKRLTSQMKCRLYADLQSQTVRECNVSDAYKHCLKLIDESQRKTGDEKSKAVPISISLCSLKHMIGTARGIGSLLQYRDVDDDLVTRCCRIWVELERVSGEAEFLRASTTKNKNCRVSLRQFVEAINKFQDIFKKDLKIAVVKARETSDDDDDEIKKIVDVAEKHPHFKLSGLKRWLEFKKAELEMAEKIGKTSGIAILANKREVDNELSALDRKSYSLVMWIPPLDGKSNEILTAMTGYVEHYTRLVAGSRDGVQEELPWHMEQRKRSQVEDKIRKFADYVDKNQSVQQVHFFLAFGESSGRRFGCRYSVYEGDNVLVENLEQLPSQPTNLHIQMATTEKAKNVKKSPSISVTWDYEDLGYPTNFIVEYKTRYEDETWKQQKSSKNQLILSIQPGSVMEVRVAADTCIGRSEFSETADTESLEIDDCANNSQDDFENSSQSSEQERNNFQTKYVVRQASQAEPPPSNPIDQRQQQQFQREQPLPSAYPAARSDYPRQTFNPQMEPASQPTQSTSFRFTETPRVEATASNVFGGLSTHTASRPQPLPRQGQPTPAPRSSNFLAQMFTPRVKKASQLQGRNVRFSEAIRDQCTRFGQRNGLDLYSVPLTKSSEIGSIAERYSFGGSESKMLRKTILVMGATGSGKTTLINSMINYIFDVQWTDNFRFQLIQEQIAGQSQAHSQTSKITAYDIYHQEGFRVPYSVTIVDTPGYGDTKGLGRDKEITEMVRTFFEDKNGIQELDVVGFVASASSARLTPTQMYIFESIFSIFGKDVKENIDFLLTFADSQYPPVLKSIAEADLSCPTDSQTGVPLHHKFNNSGFFCSNRETGNTADKFNQFFWDMGMKSFNEFFNELIKMKSKSLSLTKQVLEERKQLEATVEGLQPLIKIGLSKMEEMRKLKQVVTKSQPQIDANKNVEFEFEVNVAKKVEAPSGTYLTNCNKCNITCHYPCIYENNSEKVDCAAMDRSMPSDVRCCTVCPENCLWTLHSNQPYKWEYVLQKQMTSTDAIRAAFDPGSNTNMTAQDLIQALQQTIEENEEAMVEKVETVTKCIARLEAIALRPNPFSSAQYIDLIIDAEQQEQLPGFEERIISLERLRDMAKIINDVKNKSPLVRNN